ncbi:hypothetical protein HPB50_002844 [Hyalomma asiaticum]|uniref:Uncharacterized protein n=1 Tax=Hyalomma asiaticum TaxID=266040 RepID=A0ACB7SE89_HYAAI|nr:hypothetical protein HPB50_002844 [Hyalomma asiaticum]
MSGITATADERAYGGNPNPKFKHFSEMWESGDIPATRKQSKSTMLAKPKKSLNIDNLCAIPRISRVRTLFEHMVKNRLNPKL